MSRFSNCALWFLFLFPHQIWAQEETDESNPEFRYFLEGIDHKFDERSFGIEDGIAKISHENEALENEIHITADQRIRVVAKLRMAATVVIGTTLLSATILRLYDAISTARLEITSGLAGFFILSDLMISPFRRVNPSEFNHLIPAAQFLDTSLPEIPYLLDLEAGTKAYHWITEITDLIKNSDEHFALLASGDGVSSEVYFEAIDQALLNLEHLKLRAEKIFSDAALGPAKRSKWGMINYKKLAELQLNHLRTHLILRAITAKDQIVEKARYSLRNSPNALKAMMKKCKESQ